MRTLSNALKTAQQALTLAPVFSAVLRAKRGSASRLDVTTLFSQAGADLPTAVCQPFNGNLARAVLAYTGPGVPPVGFGVFVQSLPASAGSAWTTFTVLASGAAYGPLAGRCIAMAAASTSSASPHFVGVAYLTAAGTVNVSFNAADGVGNAATWSAPEVNVFAAVITDIGIAFAPNNDMLLVAVDNGGTIRARWRNGATGVYSADITLVPPAAASINSVACTYSGADWYVLFGWSDGTLARLSSAIFGNGGQQAAHTWSAITDVLGLGNASGDTPIASSLAWGTDGGHAIIVERWAGAYTNNQNFSMECSSTSAFAAGLWTEPAPFPCNALNGCSIAASNQTGQGNHYVASSYPTLVSTLAAPADQDVSSRIVAMDYTAEYHAGAVVLTLDNSDGALTSLATSRGTVGLRLDIALGYSAGTSPFPQRWVVKVEQSSTDGRSIVTLTAHDGWQLLHQLIATRQAQFGTALGLPTLTIDQIVHWMCAKAGINYTAPAATTLNARTPNWTILPYHTYGAQMLDLLDRLEGFLLMTDYGATTIPIGIAEASTYTYSTATHPVIQVFHQEELQPANVISVYNGTNGVVLFGQSFDTSDAKLLGETLHTHVDALLENANVPAEANALLRKSQVSGPIHSFACFPQVAQEIGDVVTFTNPFTSNVFNARVRSFRLQLDLDKGTWQQTFGCSTP